MVTRIVQFMVLLLPGCRKLAHQLWMKQVQNGIMNDSILEDFYLFGAKGIYVDTWAVEKDEKEFGSLHFF